MKKLAVLTCLLALLPNFSFGKTEDATVEIYLLNKLDEARGYCLDIRGHKFKAKVDKGLQVHTCYSYQGGISVDQGFSSIKLNMGQFFLPSFGVCMEASSIFPSSKLRLRKCNNGELQKFELNTKGKIMLIKNKKLCLTVGKGISKKGKGGSPTHLMRNLSLENCNDVLKSYQSWNIRKNN